MRHLVIALAAAALCASATCGTARADDARSLLAKHTSYVGRSAGVVTSYRADNQRVESAAPSETEAQHEESGAQDTTYRRGRLYRTEWHGEGVERQEGCDGARFWRSNMNRYTVTEYGNAAHRRVTLNEVLSDALDAETTQVQDRGAQSVDGRSVRVLRVTPRDGVEADVAVDPETGGYVAFTVAPDDPRARSVVHVVGYKEVAPGVRVPAGYRYGESRTTYTLVGGTARAVSDDELRPPSPSPRWTFGKQTPPVDLVRYGETGRAIYVSASVNGHPGRFLLDSGASHVLLFKSYADKIGLTMLGRAAYTGVAGRTVAARYAHADSIAFGDNVLSNVVVVVGGGGFSRVDGLMGYDVLAGAVVNVDLVKQTIAFGDPAAVEPVQNDKTFVLGVNLANRTPEVAVSVGDVPTFAMIDTGASSFIKLSENLKTSGRIVALHATTRLSAGVDGVSSEPDSCYVLHEVSLGGIHYKNPLVCLGKERIFGRDGGLIGTDFLRHFNWTFDYPRSRIVLTLNGS